jgi:hypothetical protein
MKNLKEQKIQNVNTTYIQKCHFFMIHAVVLYEQSIIFMTTFFSMIFSREEQQFDSSKI